jgi:RNA polymerase sigma-70 factor (ECF subfamily)
MQQLEQLIVRAQLGEKEAFGQIYQLFYKRIYRFCRTHLYDDETAADICQETFVKAWKALPRFNQIKGDSFQAFLFQIARNLLIDKSRKKKELQLEFAEEVEDKQSFEDEIDKQAEMQKLNLALNQLNEIDKQIIVLRFFEDLSFSEVSLIIKVNEGALRVRAHRSLKKLKEILENG